MGSSKGPWRSLLPSPRVTMLPAQPLLLPGCPCSHSRSLYRFLKGPRSQSSSWSFLAWLLELGGQPAAPSRACHFWIRLRHAKLSSSAAHLSRHWALAQLLTFSLLESTARGRLSLLSVSGVEHSEKVSSLHQEPAQSQRSLIRGLHRAAPRWGSPRWAAPTTILLQATSCFSPHTLILGAL